MNNNRIIYVLGADFSGTTLLDLILGSTSYSASLGELFSFMEPTSKAHEQPRCSCGSDCGLWQREKFGADPYSVLHAWHQKSVLIDSSKHPTWLLQQKKANPNLKLECILIWKDPYTYAQSCANRGNNKGWADKWLRYHRAVLQLEIPVYSLSLQNLVDNPEPTLEKLCHHLDLPFEKSMLDYKSHQHHIVFGSATARLALHEPGSDAHRIELKSSKRLDFQGRGGKSPIEPPVHVAKEIDEIGSLLEGDGIKPAHLLPGGAALRRAALRKSIERLFYRVGIDPGAVARRYRQYFLSAGRPN